VYGGTLAETPPPFWAGTFSDGITFDRICFNPTLPVLVSWAG